MKITKRQLKRIIREEKSRLLEGYKEEREKAAASTHFKPAPQFPKMTYPEDRAKAGDDTKVIETVYQNLNDLAKELYGDGYDDIAGEILAQLELLEPMRRR